MKTVAVHTALINLGVAAMSVAAQTTPTNHWPLGGGVIDIQTFVASDIKGAQTEAYSSIEGGAAFVFDGNTYIDTLLAPTWDTSDDVTISAWVKMPMNTPELGESFEIIGFEQTVNREVRITILSDGAVRFKVRDDSGSSSFAESNTGLCDGQWRHFAGVRNTSTGTVSIFVNGQLASSVPDSTSNTINAAPDARTFYIGASNHSGGVRYIVPSGVMIRDVRLYDAALDVSEIAQFTPCPADLATPFGVLDFSDVVSFLTAFADGCP